MICNKWEYNNKEINNLEDIYNINPDIIGFVYIIFNNNNNKFYIGKKTLLTTQNKKLGKKELLNQPITRGRKKTTKLEIKESNWKDYIGSNKNLINDAKNNNFNNIKKEILYFATSKKELTYLETRTQFDYRVLERQDCYCDNILSKFYSHDFIKI